MMSAMAVAAAGGNPAQIAIAQAEGASAAENNAGQQRLGQARNSQRQSQAPISYSQGLRNDTARAIEREIKANGGTVPESFKNDGNYSEADMIALRNEVTRVSPSSPFANKTTGTSIPNGLLPPSLQAPTTVPASSIQGVTETLQRINSGGTFPHRNDGTNFQNREGQLPPAPAGYYTEYVVPTQGIGGAGLQRLVLGGTGEIYYTPNHYQTFIRIKP
jgi:guanyl-specific ribonuclease Sa